MNKLERYIKRKGKELGWVDGWSRIAFKEGFDTAMALDLAVKFRCWERDYISFEPGHGYYLMGNKQVRWDSFEEMYKYWIGNVYKPE